jgi:hypothetical protein
MSELQDRLGRRLNRIEGGDEVVTPIDDRIKANRRTIDSDSSKAAAANEMLAKLERRRKVIEGGGDSDVNSPARKAPPPPVITEENTAESADSGAADSSSNKFNRSPRKPAFGSSQMAKAMMAKWTAIEGGSVLTESPLGGSPNREVPSVPKRAAPSVPKRTPPTPPISKRPSADSSIESVPVPAEINTPSQSDPPAVAPASSSTEQIVTSSGALSEKETAAENREKGVSNSDPIKAPKVSSSRGFTGIAKSSKEGQSEMLAKLERRRNSIEADSLARLSSSGELNDLSGAPLDRPAANAAASDAQSSEVADVVPNVPPAIVVQSTAVAEKPKGSSGQNEMMAKLERRRQSIDAAAAAEALAKLNEPISEPSDSEPTSRPPAVAAAPPVRRQSVQRAPPSVPVSSSSAQAEMMGKLERQKNKIESGSRTSSELKSKSLHKKLLDAPRADVIGILHDCAVWLGPGAAIVVSYRAYYWLMSVFFCRGIRDCLPSHVWPKGSGAVRRIAP